MMTKHKRKKRGKLKGMLEFTSFRIYLSVRKKLIVRVSFFGLYGGG